MVLELSKLNTVDEWALATKWDVRFRTGDGPEGYTDWLPAVNLTTPVYNISSYDFSSGHRTFSLPKAMDYPDISMTLIEDDKRTIKKFLKNWFETAFPESGGIQYLSEMVKYLEVIPLNVHNERVEKETYIVFPVGSVATPYTSESGLITYSVNFKIAGYSRD